METSPAMDNLEERPSKLRKLSHFDDVTSTACGASVSAEIASLDGLRDAHPEAPIEQHNGICDSAEIRLSRPNGQQNSVRSSHQQPTSENTDGDGTAQEIAKPRLSKSQLKKLKKAEQWEAGKDYRRAKRKEKIKEKKARKGACRTAGQRRPGSTTGYPKACCKARTSASIFDFRL
jgi:FtsZ-interacting cell division protein ZipA